MKLLGTAPVDDAEAGALITQALTHLQQGQLHAAINGLESAALCASAPQLAELYDTLCTLYVRTNQYAKLITLMGAADKLTPSLTLGALVVERNRRQGLATSAALPPFKSLLSTLLGLIGDGRYSFDELCVICSLLTQIGEASAALALLDALVGLQPKTAMLDEELVTAVLTLALDRKLKREAQSLIDKLSTLSPDWHLCTTRYRILMGGAPTESLSTGTDKVLDFLNLNQTAAQTNKNSHAR